MTSSEKLLQKLGTPSDPIAVIDGDLLLYRAAAAAEEETDWGDDVWSLSTDLKVAKDIFEYQLEQITKEIDVTKYIVALSGSQNFRTAIVDPTYKASRKKSRKPVGYRAFVDWCRETHDTYTHPLLEADDVIGIMGTIDSPAPVIMVSDDKDLMGCYGHLYRPQSGERLTITKAQADRHHLLQTLTGDATDGYGGCPKVGPKTAEKILGSHPTWNAVVAAFQKAGLSADYALTQARLARILRITEWNSESEGIRLWTPDQ